MNNIIKIISFIIIIILLYQYLQNEYTEYYTQPCNTLPLININDFIDSIYVITMPSRIHYVIGFYKSFNIDCSIFNAILIKDLHDYNNVYNLKLGEIACASSHMKVLNDFLETNNKNILIFEDDITYYSEIEYKNKNTLGLHINNYIYHAFISLPPDWDLLYLGRCWDDCNNHIHINKYIVQTYRTLCNHSILYSRKGAKILLDNISHPLKMPIDHIIANLTMSKKLKCYATKIPIFYQNRKALQSSIGNFDELRICL